MRIGIVYKEEDKLIAATAKKVIAELKAAGHKIVSQNAQFIMTFGGDGTILRAARLHYKTGTPLLPVHLGGLGILSEITLPQIHSALEQIQNKKYKIDSRMMIEVQVKRKGKTILDSLALNDVVIGKSNIARTIKLEAFQKDLSVANFVGDGLIISTPTGSTAYNFAVCGPILPPQAEALILSPICPHRAANRSIVLTEPVLIKIQKGEDVLITVDGQKIFKLQKDDGIFVYKSKYRTNFIRLKDYNLWELLKTKLGWG